MLINVTKTYLPPLDEYVHFLEQVWATHHVTNNGPLAQRLERELEAYLGVPHVRFVSNGTIALQLAIKALGITGEVITTPYSYVATTTSILWQNCTPVFVDIEPDTLCIDPDLIEKAITDRTTAILATHVYGYPCDVDRIGAIAAQHGLRVIYDAAHAFAVRLRGTPLVDYGDVSTLSFHATKLFHTVEGGAVVARDPELIEAMELLRAFGHRLDDYRSEGINGKNSELHAAMGLCVLPRVDSLIEARRSITERYDELLEGLPLRRPRVPADVDHNFAYHPVLFDTAALRLRVHAALQAAGVHPRRYFWPSLNTLPYVAGSSCPVSEDAADRVLTLPHYPGLDDDSMARIASILRSALQ